MNKRDLLEARANHVRFFVGYRDLFDANPTVEQLAKLLAPYNATAALRFVTGMNTFVCIAPDATRDYRTEQIQLAKAFFDDDLLRRLGESPFAHDDNHFIFHRHQQLYLARAIFQNCSPDQGKPVGVDGRRDLALACLIVNDLLGTQAWSRPPNDADEMLLIAAFEVMPYIEMGSDHHAQDVTGRAVQLWIDLPARLATSRRLNRVDIGRLFADRFGLQLATFLRVLFVTYAKFVNDKEESPLRSDAFTIQVRQFDHTRYSEHDVRSALEILSRPIDELRPANSGQTAQRIHTDFADLQRHPLVKLGTDLYGMFDLELILKFLTHGVWMCVEEAIGTDNRAGRDRFRELFGQVFERYCNDVWRHVYTDLPHGHSLVTPARFQSGAEVCDVFVDGRDAWIACEAKGVLINPNIKHGRDLDAAIREIHSKFVGRDESGKRKAVKQLAHSIKKLLGGERMTTLSVEISAIENIYPVIICYDVAVGGQVLSQYLDREFRKSLSKPPRLRPVVRPLTMLTVADIEFYSAVGKRLKLQHLLAQYRNQPPFVTFRNFLATRHKESVREDEAYTVVNLEAFHSQIAAEDFVV